MTMLMKLSGTIPLAGSGHKQWVRAFAQLAFSTTTLKFEIDGSGFTDSGRPSLPSVQSASPSGTPVPLPRAMVIANAAISSGPPAAPLLGACLKVTDTVLVSPTFPLALPRVTCTQLIGSAHAGGADASLA